MAYKYPSEEVARAARRRRAAARSRVRRQQEIDWLVSIIEDLTRPWTERRLLHAEVARLLPPGETITVLDFEAGGSFITGGVQ